MSVFIIAELGVNHNGDIEIAKKLIDAAVESGADAVKFQSFKAENLVTNDAKLAEYQIKNLDQEKISQLEMLKRLELTKEDFYILKQYCDKREVEFLCTPFDELCADFLSPIVEKIKISSGDLTTHPFLKHIGKYGKPVILSTGMGTIEEINKAIQILKASGVNDISLLHCTSNYPCLDYEVNLKAIVTMSEKFGLPIGYSDHSMGHYVAIAAVALGATILEKHITLDQDMKGPDHKASASPEEFRKYVEAVRFTERILGDGIKKPTKSELENSKIARKSLVWAKPLKAGMQIGTEHILWKRPGTGIPTNHLDEIIGTSLRRDVREDTLIQPEDYR